MKRSNSKISGAKEPKRAPPAIPQETADQAPAGWREVQKSIAESSGISVLLVEGHQPPALAVSNNNSICELLQSSPRHVKLCDPFCGEAHGRAIAADTIIQYRCHAGLQCFAMPVKLDSNRRLGIIGGRAFVRSSDYRQLAERFRSGDLAELVSDDLFRNVIFADAADLEHAALKLSKAANEFTHQRKPAAKRETAPDAPAKPAAPKGQKQPPPADDEVSQGAKLAD